MWDVPNIRGPLDGRGILRTGDDEMFLRQMQRRFQKKLLQLRLAVGSVSPHVAQVRGKLRIARKAAILLRIEGTVQRHGPRGSEVTFDLRQQRPTRKAEVEIEQRDLIQ